MVSKEQFVKGVIRYADNEIIPHLPTMGKWGVGTIIVLAKNQSEQILDQLIVNPLVLSLGVTNNDGMIDVNLLASAMRQSAEKYGKMQIDVPMIGTLTFSASDVDKIKNYINGGDQR